MKKYIITGTCTVLLPVILATGHAAEDAGFGDYCAMGMSMGRKVVTDCSITWDSKEGKTYCFGS